MSQGIIIAAHLFLLQSLYMNILAVLTPSSKRRLNKSSFSELKLHPPPTSDSDWHFRVLLSIFSLQSDFFFCLISTVPSVPGHRFKRRSGLKE